MRTNFFAFLALSITVFSICGCSTIVVNAPGAMIESPEIQSAPGKFEFGFGYDDAARYVYTADASARPPNLSNPEIQDGSYLFGRAGYTVVDWLEIGMRLMPGAAENLLFGGIGATARIQLVGTGPGPGIKVAIFGGALQTESAAHGDQNGTFGNGGYNWKASAHAVTLTGGGSIGVRFTKPDILVFVAGGYADQALSGSITQDASSNGLSPAASYSLANVRGQTATGALGLRLGKEIQFGVEARLIKRNWPGLSVPETRGGGESTRSTYAISLYFPL